MKEQLPKRRQRAYKAYDEIYDAAMHVCDKKGMFLAPFLEQVIYHLAMGATIVASYPKQKGKPERKVVIEDDLIK